MNITNKDKEYMAEAIKLSERSVESGGGPFGTIIVKDGKIIGSGSPSDNRQRSNGSWRDRCHKKSM